MEFVENIIIRIKENRSSLYVWDSLFDVNMPSKIHLKQSTGSIFVKTTGVNCDYRRVDLEKAIEPHKEQDMP